MTQRYDIIVLGSGMAGASVSAQLAQERRVVLVEVEAEAGRHATSRSAATFFESYGNPTVRALTRASRPFLEQPPRGMTETPLLRSRHALFVADARRLGALDEFATAMRDATSAMPRLDAAQSIALCPILRPGWIAGSVLDTSGSDLDVATLHQGYLRLAKRAGLELVLGAREVRIERKDEAWHVQTALGGFAAPVLVNATGAWGDSVARSAGVQTVGLEPLRRTCVTVPAPAGHDIRDWPMVIDIDEDFYFKPDAGQLLVSPANEDLSEPCDAVADEMDVALAIDRFERATTVNVTRLNHRWAGLRSFVADRSPVAGFDDRAPGFFWLLGQGGYGIQMAPALARLAAALVLERDVPEDIRAQGVSAQDVSPSRSTLRRGQ